MWIAAKLQKRKTAEGRLNIAIVYVNDDGRTVYDSFDAQPGMTDASISEQAVGRLKQLNGQETAFAAITEGGLDVSIKDPPPPPPPPPDPDPKDVARRKFLGDYATVQQLQRAVAVGLIPSDDPRIAAAQKTMTEGFLPEYLSIL